MDKEKTCKIGALYIATLKGIALINQNSHWLSRGEAFYGKHLLFERIYNSALKDLDLAAEKFVGSLVISVSTTICRPTYCTRFF
jgi:DNA-binding ferritin-like protein